MQVLELGTLKVRGSKIKIPDNPVYGGDTFGCNSTDIKIVNTKQGKAIRWLPLDREKFHLPQDKDIYICDRNILMGVSWDTLKDAGYVDGVRKTIDGKRCIIRMMTGSDGSYEKYGAGGHSEWDMMMDQYNEDNDIVHWSEMYSWCRETYCGYSDYRLVRGSDSARDCYGYPADITDDSIGWRPVLEVLRTDL